MRVYMCMRVCVCECVHVHVCVCKTVPIGFALWPKSLFKMLLVHYFCLFIAVSIFILFNFSSEPEKVEQSENSLSSEQVSLLLQKVFTKDRLKAILLQEEEEDQSKVQNLQQDLEGKHINMI